MTTYTPNNILITGAAGFITSNVANRLTQNYPDYKIVVLETSRTQPKFKFVKGDIGSADHVSYLLVSQSIDTIMHFAAQTHAEMLVIEYGRSYGLPVITTRGNNVYGPNQFPEKLIPKFIILAMRGEPLPIHGDGSNVRSYLYCEDVAEVFEVILHRGEVGHVYNIGTEKERRVIDVVKDICKFFSRDVDAVIKFVDNRPFNDQKYFLNNQKMKKLGWSEGTTWEDGLKKTIDWYTCHSNWWGNVSGALLPHPRMIMLPGIVGEIDKSRSDDITLIHVSNNIQNSLHI